MSYLYRLYDTVLKKWAYVPEEDLGTPGSLALGETSGTAYRGDRGKTAYDHSQTTHAPATAEQNVNADWNSGSGDSEIVNKPTNLVSLAAMGFSAGGFVKQVTAGVFDMDTVVYAPLAHKTNHVTGGSDEIAAFTASASGLVPLSGGGTTNFLRADGTWQSPGGGGLSQAQVLTRML